MSRRKGTGDNPLLRFESARAHRRRLERGKGKRTTPPPPRDKEKPPVETTEG